MHTAHAGMQITNAEFDAFVKDVKASLAARKIAEKEQKEFLDMVESTRGVIVQARRQSFSLADLTISTL